MTPDRLTFVALNVSDLSTTLHFYRDLVGIQLHESSHDAELEDPWYGGDHAAYSWTDGAFMHFAIYPQLQDSRSVTTAVQIGFHVRDFESVYARLSESDSKLLQEPRDEPWGKTARFLDPDGNIVSITEQ